MRVAFAGTPAFAATALKALLQAGFDVPLVFTQPDRPAGRGQQLQASAVKQLAVDHQLPIVQPQGLKLDGRFADDARAAHQALLAARVDAMVVVAYGLIVPPWVLEAPRLGCLNIHGSLLPRWRGAAPIQRAIEAGDELTGITIIRMDAGLDTGDMVLKGTTPIASTDSSTTIHERLADLGAALIIQALKQGEASAWNAQPQDASLATYAHKIDKAEAVIDWRQDATAIERRLRAFDPFPGCTMTFRGQPLKLWRARVLDDPVSDRALDSSRPEPGSVTMHGQGFRVTCGRGALDVLEVQRAGGKRVSVAAFVQGLGTAS